MWAHALEVVEQAERLHRQFFRLTTSRLSRPVWEPPIDIFEDANEVIIVVALPGASADHVEVVLESGAVVIRAESPIPFGGANCAIQRLEIPYGYFERRIQVATERLEPASKELANGCLTLRLRKAR
jgi:HSP20 family protein